MISDFWRNWGEVTVWWFLRNSTSLDLAKKRRFGETDRARPQEAGLCRIWEKNRNAVMARNIAFAPLARGRQKQKRRPRGTAALPQNAVK
jgi:hypothetical protein